MNLGVISVRNDRVLYMAMALIVIGGFVAYNRMGRLEDPEFTIKEALIITPYPGASAEEVAKEVTTPIESACQQLGQLDRVESESSRGRSVVSVVIKDQYDKHSIPQVWDELRRKIADAQPQLPPSVRGNSRVVDDFGDVYGIFLAVTGEGYSYPELRRYTEFLRRELQAVSDVKKVELFGEQQELVFLEISRHRLARLGINEDQIYRQLQARNVAADGGRVRIGDEHIALDPKGSFNTADEMLDLVIGSDNSGRQLFLRDVATLERGDPDPPRRLLRYDGQPAIGIGISTVQGGNVVTVGHGVRAKLAELKKHQPIGIEIGEINFQPEAVTAATNEFIFNLFKAVAIVVVVLLFAMGRKTGLIIGMVLFLTIMATFLVMFIDGDILMERISLGALIIALCMLTDNAIIIIEGIRIRIEAGENKLAVVRDAVAENQVPLFGATAIAVVAFAAIGLSDDSTGEYCNSLFWVILISLTLSWISAITITPLLSYLAFNPVPQTANNSDPYGGIVFTTYRAMLIWCLQNRWIVVIASILLFIASLYGFTLVKQSFFPPATRPQFMVDTFLPAGTHIRESEAFADDMGKFIRDLPDVSHLTTFIGGGGLRFVLVYSVERENRAYVQFLVDVDDDQKIDGLIEKIQNQLDTKYPNANSVAKKFLLGPGAGGRVQARFRGPDPEKLRTLAAEAREIIDNDGGAVCVRHDWREREKVLRPDLLEMQARRNGLTRVEVAQALETGLEGRVVGFYREPGAAGAGIYPQETRLLPIIARPPLDERSDVSAIQSMQIWSPAAGRMIPFSQVATTPQMEWENPVVMRRDRFPTITVHADPRTGLPSVLFRRVREKIEKIELPPGYSLEWGGEYEDSSNARAALARQLPAALVLMVFIVICLFNSIRTTAVIWLTVPLAIIGITGGLLLTGVPFGFMALLGALALGGEQIKNSIVVLNKVAVDIAAGKAPHKAILDGCTAKLRPVMMVAITTVLGMIPLLSDPFFSGLAVTVMFGLMFACVLTMFVVPVLYAIFFNINENTPAKEPVGDAL
ncbi:Swarming motility protein SwrC [Anatilimnocola aggregata]|uniref:Swarming motility protein SwrC n=1 Tax=Anatilimnocola aggregata TaxID=2528021 RepID=A0A517YNG7_9BACT|nr:efflux RND transporter permease subunit [Anatilimnocola aggregata]QDU31761.1 Swarming motility protein SwrC [Anatilimnocola aggregata]